MKELTETQIQLYLKKMYPNSTAYQIACASGCLYLADSTFDSQTLFIMVENNAILDNFTLLEVARHFRRYQYPNGIIKSVSRSEIIEYFSNL